MQAAVAKASSSTHQQPLTIRHRAAATPTPPPPHPHPTHPTPQVDTQGTRPELVLSERQALLTAAVASLQEGDTVVGTVSRLEDYGAFVALAGPDGEPNGVQGLLHKSEMSWGMVMTVDEVVSVGEAVEGGQLGHVESSGSAHVCMPAATCSCASKCLT